MKPIALLEALLAVGIVLVVGIYLSIDPDPSQRNYVYAPEMQDGPAYKAQDPTPGFLEGGFAPSPPEGTIPRTFEPYHVGDIVLDTSELWRKLDPAQQTAWHRLQSPWDWEKLDAAAKQSVLARGEAVFVTFCAVCHGLSGAGDGTVTKRGVTPPKPYQDPDVLAMSDGQMFRSITFGRLNMASYASQVGREDRWKVIRYIRSLQQKP